MHRSMKHALAVAVVAAGMAAPSAMADSQDLRSPDTRDAAGSGSGPLSDFRSPDARDAANGLRQEAPVTPSTPASTSTATSSADAWYEEWAVLGGAGLALVLAAGGALVFEHHRRAVRLVPRHH